MKDLTILAVGDAWIGGEDRLPPEMPRYQTHKERADLFGWLEKVAPVLQQGDVTMGNLEAPICEPVAADQSKAGTGGATGFSPPEAAPVLKRAGFNAMCVANNHSLDFGVEGLLQTIAHLKKAGIAVSGAGRDIKEARTPVILERDGVKVGLLSYSSTFIPGVFPAGEKKPGITVVGINTAYQVPGNVMYAPGAPPRIITTAKPEDKERMLEDVKRAKAEADVVVVNWHWGLSRYASALAMGVPMEDAVFYVCNYQEDLGRAAIDAGADMVLGHHPHRLQGMELYKGKLICYSLGLIVMPFSMGINLGQESVIVKGYVDRKTKRLTKVTLIPMLIPTDTMQPYIPPMAEAGRVISELERLSKKYKTQFKAEGEEIAIKA